MQTKNGTLAVPSADSTASALEEYLAAVETGTAPPREQFLARYPELAEDLDACLAALQFIGRAAEGPRSVVAEMAEAQTPEPASGQLGDFRILREVGRGGMGVVYEAEQVSLGRRVALKVLPFAATMDPRQLQRFQNEARAAAALDHPHIVHVHAVGCERGVHYYAMQFIDGQTLDQMIADLRLQIADWKKPGTRKGESPATNSHPTQPYADDPACKSAICNLNSAMALTPPGAALSTERTPRDRAYFRRVAELGIQAAEALDHAHALGIVHRDVKPANLLVDGRGTLWVTDFGLAHIQSDSRLTMTGDLVGTLRNMSPEQALAKRVVVDHRTDVYSLGATLYELLTLEPAFSGNDRQELLRQIAFEEPKPLRRLSRAIPAELETVVMKAMEKNPAERYATAKELADDLRRLLADEPIRARRPTLIQQARKWGRRHKAEVRTLAGAVMFTLAVLTGTAGWWLRDRAIREGDTERGVSVALEESQRLQHERRIPEALGMAQRAEAVLAAGADMPALQTHVQERLADLMMITELEEVRAQREDTNDPKRFILADQDYARTFRAFGIDVDVLPSDTAGERIRQRSVAVELAAALDDWSSMVQRKEPADEARAKRLLALARAADPDPLRGRLRRALESGDVKALQALVASIRVEDLPPATVVTIASVLGSVDPHRMKAVLRQAQRFNPTDFWINWQLAFALANPPEGSPPDHDGSIRFYSQALALRPQHSLTRNNLGYVLLAKGEVDEAIAKFGEAIRLKPHFAPYHNNLAIGLARKKQVDEAIAVFQKAIALDPNYFQAHYNLGCALFDKKDMDGALAELQKAIALDPKDARAHFRFGLTLHIQGRPDQAIAEYQEAIRLNDEFADAHCNLGCILCDDKGQLDEAITEFRKAIRLKKPYARAQYNLSNALQRRGHYDESIAVCREAIRLDNNYAESHNNLGEGLRHMGQLQEAIAEFREAIRLKENSPSAHYNLALALRSQGQFAEALTHFRRSHELGSKSPRWSLPSAQAIQDCELIVKLDAKLPAVLSGHEEPSDVGQRLAYARLCHAKHLFAAGVRFYRQAIAAQPDLVASPPKGHRYDAAACAAALAGRGAGDDTHQLTGAERMDLRIQALDWLQADLDAWRDLLDGARPEVARKMQHWLRDHDFDGVRGPDALAKLPEAERESWRKLWADVAATLAQAQGNGQPEEKKGSAAQGPQKD
jgi:serine/threonine protein kinase/Tfp pilus assembly protein PilF